MDQAGKKMIVIEIFSSDNKEAMSQNEGPICQTFTHVPAVGFLWLVDKAIPIMFNSDRGQLWLAFDSDWRIPKSLIQLRGLFH